jgi:hypothetical protein
MKAKFLFFVYVWFSLMAGTLLNAQTNDFKIGIIAGGQTRSSSGYVTSVYYPVGSTKYSSVFGILKEDGFNLIRMYEPFIATKQQFKDLIILIGNHGMQAMTSFNDFAYKVDYKGDATRNKNIWDLGDADTWDGYYLNNLQAFNDVYNVTPYKDIIWGHTMIGEYNPVSPFPYTNKNGTVNFRPDRWAPIGDTIYYGHTLIPLDAAEEQFIKFDQLKTSYNKQKLIIAPGTHGQNIGFDSSKTGNASYAQAYLKMAGRFDACYDAGYYSRQYNKFNSSDLSQASSYLWKFDNIDYEKLYFKDVYAEFDVAREVSPKNVDWTFAVAHTATLLPRTNPNFDLAWFNVYTSIIHGVKGVVFYDLNEMYAKPDDFGLPYDDATRQANFSNEGNPDRFIRNSDGSSNLPNYYDRFLRHLIRELAYLKNCNLLSSDPTTFIYSKTISPDKYGILPACSEYLSHIDTITIANSKGLFNEWWTDVPPYQTFKGANDERFGLRYSIRTNGESCIMIISNPTPFFLYNIPLDFSKVANPVIKNSSFLEVLFEDNSVNVDDPDYKTNRQSDIDLNQNKVGKSYDLPVTNKKCTLNFGAFDVHVLKFR